MNHRPNLAARSAIVAALVALLVLPALASADFKSIQIEGPDFATGAIDAQHGWKSLGATGGALDHFVNDLSAIGPTYDAAYTAAFGARALRISNGQTSGGFGNQTFSSPTTNEAGETSSDNEGQSGGSRQNAFSATFTVASARPGVNQPGLYLGVSPDRGDGSRGGGLLRILDNGAGSLELQWSDYKLNDPAFTTHLLGTMSNDAPHQIRISLRFYDGATNDVVRVYVDGQERTPVEGLTTWEDYSRNFGEPDTVDSLLFRTSGTAAPANQGYGYLIDDLQLLTQTLSDVGIGPSGETGATGATGASGVAGVAGQTGADGANGANGANGKDGAAPVLASALRFGSGKIKRSGRAVRVPVLCNASGVERCVGTLELRKGKKLLASQAFAIAPGQKTIKLRSSVRIRKNSKLSFTLRGFAPTGAMSKSKRTRKVK